jgi:hypothetical protein
MLKSLIISSLLLLTTLCPAQVLNLAPILGHWENSDDKRNHIYITEKYIIEKYDEQLIDTFYYSISSAICDTTYLKPGVDTTALFLVETNIHTGDQYCFEILNCGENGHLSFRYAFNGYLNEFDRKKE